MEKEMYQSMYETECYHWYFKSKYEIVLKVLEKYGLKHQSGKKIVDFGCGCGVMLKYLSKYGTVTGVDFSPEALKYCKKVFQGELLQANLENYSVREQYDYGVALDVIEHIENDELALRNMYASFKKNGICVITVPAFMSLWSQHDKNCMHKRRYNKRELEKIITNSGFTVEYCSYYNFWSFPFVYFIRKIENLFRVKNSGSKLEYGFKEGFINTLLYNIFVSEKMTICKGKKFPYGVSLICVARKER